MSIIKKINTKKKIQKTRLFVQEKYGTNVQIHYHLLEHGGEVDSVFNNSWSYTSKNALKNINKRSVQRFLKSQKSN